MNQVKDYLAKELFRLVAKLPPNRSRHVEDLAHFRHAEDGHAIVLRFRRFRALGNLSRVLVHAAQSRTL